MMKQFLVTIIALFTFAGAYAADEIDGLFVWVNGTSTCYKLESTPKVTFQNSTATLTVADKEVLSLQLKSDSDLKMTFGTYQDTGINAAQTEATQVKQVGKYIMGGKLIIIKDGKQYDAKGVLIK